MTAAGLLALGAIALALSGAAAGEARTADTPRFHGEIAGIDAAARERMSGVSWRRGCPVGFADLRLLTVSHWGFDR